MAITALYVATTGSDNNGGSSEGSAIVSGNSADTDGTAVVSLADNSPDLSGVSVGDSIRLAAETAGGQGSSSEVFEITAVDDGADTVTVTPTPGTNANQTWAIGGAFATIDHAMNVVVAGNKVWVKATADYTGATNTLDTVGTSSAPITFEGYTSTTGDNGQATVSNATDGFNAGASSWYYIFKNFIITGHSDKGFDGIAQADVLTFINCNIHNNSSMGLSADNSITLIGCKIQNNGLYGIDLDNTYLIFNCVISGNTTFGIRCRAGGVIIGNLLYNNTNTGSAAAAIEFEGQASGQIVIYGNTIDGDASSVAGTITLLDMDAVNHTDVAVYNNILFDGDVGIILSTDLKYGYHGDYNIYDDITGAKRTFFPTGDNDIDDPATIGLNSDYTLTSASAAKAAGIDAGLLENATSYRDIGALQRQEAGGGTVVHTIGF